MSRKADRNVEAIEKAGPTVTEDGRRSRNRRRDRDAELAELVQGAKEPRRSRKDAERAGKEAERARKAKARKQAKGARFGDVRRVARLMLRYTSGQRRVFVLAAVMLLFEAATAVFEPLPLKYLIDFLDNGAVPSALGSLGALDSRYVLIGVLTVAMVALAAINSYGDSMAEIYLARGGRMLGYNVRVALFTHLEKLSLAFHNQRRTGDVLTRVTGDVTELEEFVTDSVSDLAGSLMVLTGTLAFLAWSSPQVLALAVVVIPLLALVSNGFTARIKAAAKQQRAREGDLASHAQEMLTSIGVIQTYGRGAYERERFSRHSNRAMQAALRAARLEAGFSWVISVLQAVCIAGVVWLGVWLVDRNASTTGDVILYILLITNMFKPTRRIIKEWNTIAKVYASVERVNDLLDREPTVRDEPGAVDTPPLRGDIEFRDVSFAYQMEPSPDGEGPPAPTRLALDHLSFHAEPGQTVALVGHSGAGKSTIAQLLPRLYDPHDGQVLLDGHDVREFTLASLRGQISMVLQETILFSGTIADNIAYGRPDATREEVVEAARKANAHEFIQGLPDGYDTELGERGGGLSGGQRQRIAIARSFIRETSILILDEPTTGLDAESTQLVVDALEILVLDKTTIVISHDLNLIRSADVILVMSAGQIVQRGTHDELIAQDGLYASLYTMQFGEAALPPASPEPEPVLVPDLVDEEEAPAPERRRAFETALMQALPLPASPEAFRLLMSKAPPEVHQAPPTGVPAAEAPPGVPAGPPPPPKRAAARPPDGPVPPPTGPVLPPTQPMEPPTGVVLRPGKPPGQAAAPRAKAAPVAKEPAPVAKEPAPAAKEAVVAPTGPVLPPAGPSTPPEPPDRSDAVTRTAAAVPEATADDGARSRDRRAGAIQLPTLDVPLSAAALDPVRIPAVRAELPGLAEALDGDGMRPRLEALLRDGYEVERCAVDKIQYLPGEACVVRYEVGIRHAASERSLERVVTARVLPSGADAAAWLHDRLEPLVAEAAGRQELEPFDRPVAVLEPLHAAVHAFPLDAELPGLLAATDPPRMAALLGELLPDAAEGRLAVEACKVELASYNRQGRCVLRYHLFGSLDDGQLVRRTVYGKVYADGGPDEQARTAADALARAIEAGEQPFAVPRAYGYRADLGLAALSPVPGAPRLPGLLKARFAGSAEAGRGKPTVEGDLDVVARVAAAIHRAPPAAGPTRAFDGELADVRRELIDVGRRCPTLGVQLSRLLAAAEAAAFAAEPFRAGPAHGDLTPAQVLFDQTGEYGLIDLDTICQAEPALDLGHFTAHLRVAVRKSERAAGRHPGGLADEFAAAFLSAYAEAAGVDDLDRLRVRADAFESVSLARMAMRSWKKLKLARLEDILRVMAERAVATREAGS
ncbi:MAG TPA: ABC transporter transmembrane domain-containing protein [Actinomycetes bacterium]|nr:ABC transporter transmembrane domain-containing protein [Actinomycetes bacterium]